MPLTVKLRRLAYRVAYCVLQVIWLLTRPQRQGVKCVLTDHGRVLLVRHTYGRRGWDLPGGFVKRGEPPVDAARREMREELGVTAPQWSQLGSVQASMQHRHDTIHVFGAELDAPALTVDAGEIDVAQWFRRDRMPRLAPLGSLIMTSLPPSADLGAPASIQRP